MAQIPEDEIVVMLQTANASLQTAIHRLTADRTVGEQATQETLWATTTPLNDSLDILNRAWRELSNLNIRRAK